MQKKNESAVPSLWHKHAFTAFLQSTKNLTIMAHGDTTNLSDQIFVGNICFA